MDILRAQMNVTGTETLSTVSSAHRNSRASIDSELKDAVTPLPWKTEFSSELPGQNSHIQRNDSSNLAVPKSEAESASVNDLGEARRLQNHDEEITQASTTNIAQLIDRAGTQFPDSSSELENGDPTRYLGSLQELENGELSKRRPAASLASRLRAELKSSLAGKDGKKFLPQDKFDEILTRAAVREELERHPELRKGSGEGELTRLTDRIHKASMTERDSPDSATHRRKLFALLALVQMVPSIKDFIEAKIYDRDFPFIIGKNKESDGPFYCMYSWQDLRKGDKPGARKPIACFLKWPDHQIEGFHDKQWQLLAPYFELGSLKLYNFQEDIILPFIEDTSDSQKERESLESGFSDVWRVKIHRAHHNHRPVSDDEAENPSYAIKRLKQNTREAFDKEVEALKRFSDKDNLHLIELLLTYHYRGKYHLVFPWADGNLSDFWTKHPSPDSPPRDWNFVKWAARQWLAIAEGLRAIHKAPKRNETRDPNDPRIHGRHGDLKPENILWFRYGHRKLKDPCEYGVFVISDFGLTSFHHNDTKDQVSPSRLARSPTYRPPECDVSKTISQSYDVWSLGCILLEFAIWYMHGWNGVDQASKRRANADSERPAASASDTSYVPEDKFFELTEKVTRIVEDDATIEKVARLKQCVKDEFTNLSKQGTTRFFHDLLEFVDDKLLRMRPDMRAMCDEIVAKLGEIRQKCEADEEYCTRIVPRSYRTGTNNSELRSSYKGMATIPEGESPPDEDESEMPESSRNSADIQDTSYVTIRGSFKDRQISQSPTPWDSTMSLEVGKMYAASKSSLKRPPGDQQPKTAGEMMPPPPSPGRKQPNRTDSNGTGESSPNKRVSFAETPDVVHSYTEQSPDISQQPDGMVAVSHQLSEKNAAKATPIEDTGSNATDLRLPIQISSPSIGVEHEDGQPNPPSADVRPAPIEAQGILSRERSLPLEVDQTDADGQLGPGESLAPPLQESAPISSTNVEPKPTSDQQDDRHAGPALRTATRAQLVGRLCKSLWCC